MGEALAGVAAVVWVYPLLRRWAVWRWLAGLAAMLGLVASVTVVTVDGGSIALAVALGAAVTLTCWRAPSTANAQRAAALLTVAGLVGWRLAVGDDWPPVAGSPPAVALALVVASLAVALLAVAGAGRAAASSMRWVCLVTTGVAGGGLAVQTSGLAAWAWAPAAGALGVTALARGRRGPAAAAPQTDEVDEAVLATFAAEHGRPGLGPVAVVIAAYDEAAGLPAVLQSLPADLCGLRADVVVVDDGSSDGTAEAARRAGRAYVAACPVNRGQGRALRLGYRIAREHGAAYIVTTDADGQYSPADLATVLTPVVDGRADFVTGSRRLGALENRDAVRQAGTYVFAWLASLLTGRHLTDTSFGLRAMRAEVTAAVTLNQPQYQASELLVGVLSHGFRVLEVPATMRVRSAGASKKGGNLTYGARYARVMIGTWWREGCPRPVAETAPALSGSTRDVADTADVAA